MIWQTITYRERGSSADWAILVTVIVLKV